MHGKKINTAPCVSMLSTSNKLNSMIIKNRYLYNVIPEINLPSTDAIFYGELRNTATEACFEMIDDYRLGMTYECFEHNLIPSNEFSVTIKGFMIWIV